MLLLKKLINFFYKTFTILIITFFLSLIIDYLLGKKILNLLDVYLVKTEFYGRLLRMDNSIYTARYFMRARRANTSWRTK